MSVGLAYNKFAYLSVPGESDTCVTPANNDRTEKHMQSLMNTETEECWHTGWALRGWAYIINYEVRVMIKEKT